MTEESLRAELVASIATWRQSSGESVARDTPLITSALIDSLQLFHLLVWIEEKVGRQIDVTRIDIATEWDTVDRIVAFVLRERAISVTK